MEWSDVMRCRAEVTVLSGGIRRTRQLGECLEMMFEKALYVPYTRFEGVFYEDGAPDFMAGQILDVRVRLDGVEIHYGMADGVRVVQEGSGFRVRVKSRGYTLLLAQNEPYPRINSNVTLKSLCQANLVCSAVSYEEDTPVVRNIYVNEGSKVWDAAVAYCIKASGRYPYIHGAGTVMMTAGAAEYIDYSGCVVTEVFTEINSSSVLSDVYMKELEDDYPFEAHDTSAAAMGIVRSRYYPLDMQWLYDPQVGLQHKLDYSNRAMRTAGFTYEGWKQEDLMDIALSGITAGKRINYIRVIGGKRGIFTTVKAYDDRYGQK
ncbi:hypothetical protein [Ruminococcus sp.]|uniref:hypothetical protein n=1 Tax=Ruminococcus sp. TaxID=41978 RepID=UPI0025D375D0|nr:hypothetical protein [Ruminococcus sp.]MBQ8965937.1 hypothetical protein [Ruminococcus sp.]